MCQDEETLISRGSLDEFFLRMRLPLLSYKN